ncbi:hypothetical protein DFH27DRAFT_215839 [Peziza echinospora]|nr:hypothetical protein DFH27DRAFT_215839 [Peziza echinospora]
MEALPDNLLMQTAAIVGGDDEMIDSEYDQIVANDDDYDIDLDTGENLSNTGDEEMKFDEEVATYDNDDLMLDEADYATTAQEEMIITQLNQSDTGTFLNIDMNAHGTTEVDATQSTQMEALVGTMVGMNEHHVFTQETQHEAITDSYIHSQHDFASTAQVQPTPAVDQKLQPDLEQVEQPEQPNEQTETETEPAATAEITNPEPSADVTSTDTDYTEAATTEVVHEVPVDQTPAVDSNTQEYPEAQGDSLKIHPIIVQFEANTLSLFNSVHYINYANPDDSPENAYPEVPSVFLLSDASFYSKGFDELFSGLRELFGTTIGDDAEITMDFVGLELFLHEDNLLTKSISLSDLIDLHLRLSKQDGVERPEPLYIILSTQPRFTKRYSELLTAAGEGKGLSQISTYSPTNDYTTAVDADGNAVHSPEDEFATAEEAAQGNSTSGFPTKNVDDIDQADHFSEAEPVQQPVSVAGEAGNITSAENDNVPQPQVEVQNEAVQQGEEEYVEEEEEELLPAEDEPQYIGDVVENGQEKPEMK